MAIDKALLGTLSEDEGKSIRRLVDKDHGAHALRHR